MQTPPHPGIAPTYHGPGVCFVSILSPFVLCRPLPGVRYCHTQSMPDIFTPRNNYLAKKYIAHNAELLHNSVSQYRQQKEKA